VTATRPALRGGYRCRRAQGQAAGADDVRTLLSFFVGPAMIDGVI